MFLSAGNRWGCRCRERMRSIAACAALMVSTVHGQGSVMLVGGGSESYGGWSDAPYAWFVGQADSGIIINVDVAAASDWYPPYFISFGADPTSHALQIPTRSAANNQAIYDDLVSARGIFLEGGDQWNYVATWKGTLVEDALHQVFAAGGAIGGTSAGCAVLGEVVFDAEHGTAYPQEVAYDPYAWSVTFTDDFLTVLPGVITDSHFHTRGRLGRLVPFVARRIQDFGDAGLVGIGVEENTAFCIDASRVGIVYGDCVAIIAPTEHSVVACEPATPVTFTAIHFDQLLQGDEYDLLTLRLVNSGGFLLPVTGAAPPDPIYSDVILDGSSELTGNLGEIRITGMTYDPDAWWSGELGIVPGQGVVPRSVIIPRLWSDIDLLGNRWVGGLYGIAVNPFFTAWYLDDGCRTHIMEPGMAVAGSLTYVVNTRSASHCGVNTSNIPGILGASLHFLGPGDSLDLLSPQAVDDLAVSELAPGSLVLSWSAPGDNMTVTGFLVYRHTLPYFLPTPTLVVATTTAQFWVDAGGVGDPSAHPCYRVTAVDAFGNESAPSNPVGAMSFPCTTQGQAPRRDMATTR
ncbi:MAG: cyanophycinase [Candidatus Eisenbacteria bacterium]|nr:cyanophycinase [Candidatus Eisenbacteria bacterium]